MAWATLALIGRRMMLSMRTKKKSPAIKRGDGDGLMSARLMEIIAIMEKRYPSPCADAGADDAGDADWARDLRWSAEKVNMP